MNYNVLDMCCGSKMFWFDKKNKNILYGDNRIENHTLCDGRKLEIRPSIKMDFTSLPFTSGTFEMVVFDPPHLLNVGKNGWQFKKYGGLRNCWKKDIKQGFSEAFRVLQLKGTLIFKWNETQIKTTAILKLTEVKPLFGHISGKRANTHWICFVKE